MFRSIAPARVDPFSSCLAEGGIAFQRLFLGCDRSIQRLCTPFDNIADALPSD